MSNETTEQPEPAEAPPSAVKRVLPMVLAATVGISVGGAAGVLVAGPVMAERAVARAEIVAEEVVGKAAAGEHGESGGKAKGGKKEGGHGEPGVPLPIYKLDNLVLNPAGSGGTRFLVASMAVEVPDEAASEVMKQRDPEVRDAVLRVLGSKTVVQLSDLAARAALKQELQVAVDSIVGQEMVSAVFFPQFVIQ